MATGKIDRQKQIDWTDVKTLYEVMNDSEGNTFQGALEQAFQSADSNSVFTGFSRKASEGFFIASKHGTTRGFAIIGSGYSICAYFAYRDHSANNGTWYARRMNMLWGGG